VQSENGSALKEKQMRVVIVNKFAHLTGGADQHCLGLAAALRARGHVVNFLSTRSDSNLEHEGSFVECSVTHGSRERLGAGARARVLGKALWNREAAAAMNELVDEFRPDVVHAHKLYPQLSAAPVVAASRRGVPVVQTLHDFEMIAASPIDVRGGRWDRDETRLQFKLLNAGTLLARTSLHQRRVSAFVAVSRFVARVHASHGIESKVLPNFVPQPDLSRGSLPPYEERRGILYFGRLRPEKGIVDVVEMAKRVPSIPVSLVGSGVLEEYARAEAETTPNLQVLGFVPDPKLLETIRRARVVVIPSRCQDAGPLVPLEAMVNGTPVVAYANGGLGEYVNDTGGGRVVPVDVEALAAAAAELHDDGEAWDLASKRGFTAVTERHTPDRYAASLEQVYEAVMEPAEHLEARR
jgi:glycosyltransferase involved in cell wall biosynthesis